MNRPIAILANDMGQVHMWLRDHIKNYRFNRDRQITDMNTGQTYVVIMEKKHTVGHEFSSYVKANGFIEWTLEDEVRQRTR